MTQFRRVEKIKVISSMYMAVAGLMPTRKDSHSVSLNEIIINVSWKFHFNSSMFSCWFQEELEPFDVKTNVVTMVNLAYHMFKVLNRMNKDNMQEFQFRIGKKKAV